jgi:hypothetical protein
VLEFSQFKWGGVGVPWVRAESPYVLKDQTLNSIIRVKAIDKAGNEYIATLIPDESLQTISQNEIITYSVLGAVTVVLLIIGFFMWYYLRRRNKQTVPEDPEKDEPIID